MHSSTKAESRIGFWKALGKLIMFQIKLAGDALRDLVMSPLSIVAFLLDILVRPASHKSFHQKLMSFGRRTDRWINLFEEFDSNAMQPEARTSVPVQDPTNDDPTEPDHL